MPAKVMLTKLKLNELEYFNILIIFLTISFLIYIYIYVVVVVKNRALYNKKKKILQNIILFFVKINIRMKTHQNILSCYRNEKRIYKI